MDTVNKHLANERVFQEYFETFASMVRLRALNEIVPIQNFPEEYRDLRKKLWNKESVIIDKIKEALK